MPPKPWANRQHVITLVAWLDFCVETGTNFDDCIVEKLKEIRTTDHDLGYVFTEMQITNKLIALARTKAQPENQIPFPGIKDIRARGSVCFPSLAENIREDVGTQLTLYYKQKLATSALSKTRKCKPSILPPEANTQEHGESQNLVVERTREAMTRLRSAVQANSSTTAASNARRGKIPPILHIRHPRRPSEYSSPRAGPNAPSDGIDLQNNERLSGLPMMRLDNYNLGSMKSLGAFENETWTEWESLVGGASDSPGQDDTSAKDRELNRLQVLWKQEVEDLRADKAKLEKRNAHLLSLNQCLETARQAREQAGKDPIESEFHSQLRCIFNLGEENHALRQVADFFRHVPLEPRSFSTVKIDDTMDEIERELESMLTGNEPSHPPAFSEIARGSEMDSLLKSGLGIRVGELCQPSFLAELISRMGYQALVGSFTLAALKDWVLYTDYPGFSPDGSSCSLLRTYREIALELGEWKGLRSYDAAAYRRMIKSSEFQEYLLPRKAVDLAHRLLKVVVPLFVTTAPSGSEDVSRNSQAFELYKGLRFRFVEIFKIGLRFKAAIALTDERYEFLIHPPGAPNPIHSTPNPSSVPPNRNDQSSRTSGFSAKLHASLNVYPEGPPNPLDRFSDAIVQQLNFITRATGVNVGELIYTKTISVETAESEIPLASLRDESRIQTRSKVFPTSSTGGNVQGTDSQSSEGPQSATDNRLSVQARKEASEKEHRDEPLSEQMLDTNCNSSDDDSSLSDMTAVDDLIASNSDLCVSDTSQDRAEEQDCNLQKKFECDKCKARFTLQSNLTRHIESESCNLCVECNKRFLRRDILDKHRREVHPNNPQFDPDVQVSKNQERKKPQCDHCGRTFKHQFSVKKHIALKRCAKCATCNMLFPRVNLLERHNQTIHGRENDTGHPNTTLKRQDLQIREMVPEDREQTTVTEEHFIDQPLPTIGRVHTDPEKMPSIDVNASNSMRSASSASLELLAALPNLCCTICDASFSNGPNLIRHRTSQSHILKARNQEPKVSMVSRPTKRQRIRHSSSRPNDSGDDEFAAKEISPSKKRTLISVTSATAPMHRESTPPTRHVARYIALVAKTIDETTTQSVSKNRERASTVPPSSVNGEEFAGDTQANQIQTKENHQPSKPACRPKGRVVMNMGVDLEDKTISKKKPSFSIIVPFASRR